MVIQAQDDDCSVYRIAEEIDLREIWELILVDVGMGERGELTMVLKLLKFGPLNSLHFCSLNSIPQKEEQV